MAMSTCGITLMKGTKESSSNNYTYSKLVDIKSFPDLGAAPQTIETTTLSDTAQTFVKGVETTAAMEFTANYSTVDYEALLELSSGTNKFALYFGENGANGKFIWDGQLSVWVVGGGVNGFVEMKISILPETKIIKQV